MRRVLVVVMLGACGRIGFESLPAEIASDGPSAASDGPSIASDGSSDAITWVKSFVQRSEAAGTMDTFTAQADHAGDAFLLHVACNTTGEPTGVTVSTTPAWSITMRDLYRSAEYRRGCGRRASGPSLLTRSRRNSW